MLKPLPNIEEYKKLSISKTWLVSILTNSSKFYTNSIQLLTILSLSNSNILRSTKKKVSFSKNLSSPQLTRLVKQALFQLLLLLIEPLVIEKRCSKHESCWSLIPHAPINGRAASDCVEPFPFQTSDVSVSSRFRSGIQKRARKRYYATRVTGDDGLRKAIGGDRRTESLNWFAPRESVESEKELTRCARLLARCRGTGDRCYCASSWAVYVRDDSRGRKHRSNAPSIRPFLSSPWYFVSENHRSYISKKFCKFLYRLRKRVGFDGRFFMELTLT